MNFYIGQRVKVVRGLPEYIGRTGFVTSVNGCPHAGLIPVQHELSVILDGDTISICGFRHNLEPLTDISADAGCHHFAEPIVY